MRAHFNNWLQIVIINHDLELNCIMRSNLKKKYHQLGRNIKLLRNQSARYYLFFWLFRN